MKRFLRNQRFFWVAALTSVLMAPPVSAQTTYSWNGAGTDWQSATTWSPGGVPTSLDDVLFQNFTQVTQTALPTLSSNAFAKSLFFDMSATDLRATTVALRGNGTTLTLGTGGAMAESVFRLRGGSNFIGLNNITINLAAGTSFSGAAAETGILDVGRGTSLSLTAATRVQAFAPGGSLVPITIKGGGVFLDSTSSLSSKTLRFFGGQMNFTGGTTSAPTPGVTTFAFGGIEARSGQIGLTINQGFVSGQTSNRVDAYFSFGGGVPGLSLSYPTSRALVSFTTPTPTVALPTPARVFFDGFGSLVTNGVIRDGGTPYVTLNNRWATYDPTNGLVPAVTTLRNGTLSSGVFPENVLVTSTTGTTLANDVTIQTLVVENSGTTLNLGGNTLFTNGLIFNGSGGSGSSVRRLTISNGNLFGTAGSVRQIVVNSTGGVEIETSANLAGGGPIAKSGSGVLSLTGTTDQLSFANGNTDVTVNAGQLRAVISGSNLNFGLNNVLQLRGGLLAVDAQGGTATFSRPLGTTAGSVNWATDVGDHGAGGFAAFNGNLIVNIGGNAQQLVWDGQTGSSQYFVRDGQHLLMNTAAGTGVIDFRNPISLDSGVPSTRATRVIQMNGSVTFASNLRPPVERTRFSGVISGSSSTNLSIPLGSGVVELPTANSYAGDTFLGTIVLLTNTTGSATGTGNVMFESATVFGSGIIAPDSGKGIQVRGSVIITQSDIGPSNLTFGSFGVANNVTFGNRLASQPSSLVVRLTPTASGRLTVLGTGQITLEPGTRLFVDPSTDFDPTTGTVIGILNNQTPHPINGVFTVNGVVVNQGEQTTAGNWRFRISYIGHIDGTNVFTTGGNDAVLYEIIPVPEPVGLVAAGGVILFAIRRRYSSVAKT